MSTYYTTLPAQIQRTVLKGSGKRTNSLAVAALVSSVPFSPLGIFFGHVAVAQIRRTGASGMGFAVAGLVIGYVTLTADATFASVVIASALGSWRGLVIDGPDAASVLIGR